MNRMLVVLMLAAACGGPREEDTLTASVRAYNEGVRWQRYEVAANALPVAERGEFVDDMDARSKDLKITDYEIVRVDARDKDAAKVQVKLSWYLDTEGKLKETHAVQTWERRNKKWWMVDATRVRGDEMPGITEPAAEAQQ